MYEFQKADVILTSGDSFISRLIQKVTKSKWNHAILVTGPNECIEATPKGIVYGDLDYICTKEHVVLRHEGMTSDLADLVIDSAKQKIGTKYDFLQLVQLGILYITGQRGNAKRIGNKNQYICSELISESYQINGLEIIPGIKEDLISPGDYVLSPFFTMVKQR